VDRMHTLILKGAMNFFDFFIVLTAMLFLSKCSILLLLLLEVIVAVKGDQWVL